MNLYVGNLSQSVTRSDLDWVFGSVGQVVFAQFANPAEGADARGYAFVHLEDAAQMEAALRALDGAYLKGQRLRVRPVVDQSRQARALRACGWRPAPAALRDDAYSL
ncbi:MAG TPA: RNA-binding protein [Acidiferrobacteraceae bacterium]|nr:RNA-binding protein [Acidiferrobacteraceae bacterium]